MISIQGWDSLKNKPRILSVGGEPNNLKGQNKWHSTLRNHYLLIRSGVVAYYVLGQSSTVTELLTHCGTSPKASPSQTTYKRTLKVAVNQLLHHYSFLENTFRQEEWGSRGRRLVDWVGNVCHPTIIISEGVTKQLLDALFLLMGNKTQDWAILVRLSQ